MTRSAVPMPAVPGMERGSSDDDDPSSKEPLPGAPAQVLELLHEALPHAAAGDMEMVDRILHAVVDVVRRAAPLPPSAWDEVRQAHARLQQEIDEQAEQMRVHLGAAGGGRKAAHRYGAIAPPAYETQPVSEDEER